MALTSHFSSRRETHRLCTMKCWFSPPCKDCAISSFRSLIPRPRFSLAANGLPLQLPSSLLLPDDKRPPHWSIEAIYCYPYHAIASNIKETRLEQKIITALS